MKRFASTRSEKPASQPSVGWAQWSVGSIEEEGMRYGFTTQALIASTIAIAPTIVTTQSIATRQPCGSPRVSRSTGLRDRCGCSCRQSSSGRPRPARAAAPPGAPGTTPLPTARASQSRS